MQEERNVIAEEQCENTQEETDILAIVLMAEYEKFKNNEASKILEELRRPLKKVKLSNQEIQRINEQIAMKGLPLITNMHDVSSMLYAVGDE